MQKSKLGNGKKKLAVLGGGLGSLSALYELTDYPGWEDHYDITVYQVGWRLGGKTATGRGIHNRIEEKGIHIFQGWYDNAFRMVKDAYEMQEKYKLNPESPFKSWSDAIKPDNASLFTEYSQRDRTWLNWPLIFPMNNEDPGSKGKSHPWVLIRKILAMSLQMIIGEPYDKKEGFLAKHLMIYLLDVNQKFGETNQHKKVKKHWWGGIALWFEKIFQKLFMPLGIKMIHRAFEIAQREIERLEDPKTGEEELKALEELVESFSEFSRWFERTFKHLIETHDQVRRVISIIEWVEVSLIGLMKDVFDPEHPTKLNYENINHYNYMDWLKKHGASDLVLTNPMVRFMYTGAFANMLDGHTGQLAADIGLRMVMVSIDYKGCLVWKLGAGTADTVITPIYQVLRHRGVKFKFFHKVLQVHDSDTGDIERISMAEQVKLKDGKSEYEPFFKVNGLNSWPNKPLFDQLSPDQVKTLKEKKVDLESSWSDWDNYRSFELKKGEDFDEVLLGISVGALKDVCKEIVENRSDWNDMVNKVRTTQTAQVQTWMKDDREGLGFNHQEWGVKKGDEPNSVVYANYLYSFTDMTSIIDKEDWPEDLKPGHLCYWCGTVPDASPIPPYSHTSFPEEQKARVMGITEQWLYAYGGWLWPNARSNENPQGFNFDYLASLDDKRVYDPIEKFYHQYYLLNVEPSDRYVLAVPGSNKYRKKADASGFNNMFLTGDWTDFDFNVGHMEGAVRSGLQAAKAIRKVKGLETKKEIY